MHHTAPSSSIIPMRVRTDGSKRSESPPPARVKHKNPRHPLSGQTRRHPPFPVYKSIMPGVLGRQSSVGDRPWTRNWRRSKDLNTAFALELSRPPGPLCSKELTNCPATSHETAQGQTGAFLGRSMAIAFGSVWLIRAHCPKFQIPCLES